MLMLLATLPVFISQTTPGLDPSYIYLLNVASLKGLKFGTDLFITYGPLGFLSSTQNYGINLLINLIFWGFVFALHAISIYKLVIRKNLHFSYTLISFILIIPLYRIGAEYYLLYIISILLSLAWFNNKNIRFFVLACILTVILMFIKFSGAFGAISFIILFCLFKLINEKKAGLKFAFASLSIPILFITGFLFYNPSFSALKDYALNAIEISSSYSSAMSISTNAVEIITGLIAVLFFILSYLTLTYFAIRSDRKSGLFLLIFIGSLFLTFKHSFVRFDPNHKLYFFIYFLSIISIIIISFDLNRIKTLNKKKNNLLITSITLLIIASLSIGLTPKYYLKASYDKVITFINIPKYINQPIQENKADLIPLQIIDSIGDKKVLIFPWELSMDAYNKINSVFMPIPQAYTAYTSKLDQINAAFIANKKSNPDYILYRWEEWNDEKGSIDNRFPTIESPETWLQIISEFDLNCVTDNYILLKRKSEKTNLSVKKINTVSRNKNQWINIPESNKIIALKAEVSLNLTGKILNFFYKIPEVNMEVRYYNGNRAIKRILPEVLTNTTIISSIPTDFKTTISFLEKKYNSNRVEQIRIVNNSSFKFLYNEPIEIDFFEIELNEHQ